MAGAIPIERISICSGRDVLVDGKYLTFQPTTVQKVINANKGRIEFAIELAKKWKAASAHDSSSVFYNEACACLEFLEGIK